ncbi:MAG: energy transducer TonB [Acidobacteria bacterium]|nr:energy transducer TonB [Acidobacteriota bacterium]MCA1651200.1 energy transducer TonB [Acidobacteriota bacterium]
MSTTASRVAAPIVLSLVFSFGSPASVRARQDSQAQGGPRLAEIKGLYESAEYDRALAAVNRANPAVLMLGEAREIEIYEALCLLALGKKVEADAKIEGVIRAEPLYQPSTDLPNRLRALVDEARNRLRPALAQSHYIAGKELFDAEEYEAAVAEFALVLQLTDVPADRSRSEFGDMRILATGFRDLSVRAIATSKPRVSEAPAPPPPRPPDAPVVPPVAVRQNLPPWPASSGGLRREAQGLAPLNGVLEIVITKTGTVGSAKLIKRIEPFYDTLLLTAARQWRYQPATRNGVPVEYVKTLAIAVNIR